MREGGRGRLPIHTCIKEDVMPPKFSLLKIDESLLIILGLEI